MKRNFKGVWIPSSVWLDRRISVMEKCFLVEIDSLDNADGCFASNSHFSDFFGVSKGRCTQIIKGLEKKGYISVELVKEGKQIKKRIVRALTQLVYSTGGSEDIEHPYLENDEGSNTYINNTILLSEFEDFWNSYDKKTGRKKCLARWKKLKDHEKKAIFKTLSSYVKSTPDPDYRKNPYTYLSGEHWEDQIIIKRKPTYEGVERL